MGRRKKKASDRPYHKIWRKKAKCFTYIFLYHVPANGSKIVVDWPDNAIRLTFVRTERWVKCVKREPIPGPRPSPGGKVHEVTRSVYPAMSRWIKGLFDHHKYHGYHAEVEILQMQLFPLKIEA